MLVNGDTQKMQPDVDSRALADSCGVTFCLWSNIIWFDLIKFKYDIVVYLNGCTN